MMPEFKETWPTTVDNPFDPFTQWDRWYMYDEKCEYHTCGQLARLSRTTVDRSEMEDEQAIDQAIQKLMDLYEPLDIYVLAVKGNTQRFGI